MLENYHEEDNLTSCVNPDFSLKGRGRESSQANASESLKCSKTVFSHLLPDINYISALPPLPVHFTEACWERRGDRHDELSTGPGPRKLAQPQYCQ